MVLCPLEYEEFVLSDGLAVEGEIYQSGNHVTNSLGDIQIGFLFRQ